MRQTFLENDGGAAVDEDAVLAMPLKGARQDGALDVGTASGEFGGTGVMRYADNVLFDDRSLVEVLGRVVGGGADELDTAFFCALLGPCAGEGRQE
jgi:hypothetical protein